MCIKRTNYNTNTTAAVWKPHDLLHILFQIVTLLIRTQLHLCRLLFWLWFFFFFFFLTVSPVSFPLLLGLFDMHSTTVPLTRMVLIQRKLALLFSLPSGNALQKTAFHEKIHHAFLGMLECKQENISQWDT